jgi:hypothetical protein
MELQRNLEKYLGELREVSGSSVSNVTGYGLDNRGSIPGGELGSICFYRHVQKGCEAHPVSYPMRSRVLSHGVNRPEHEANLHLVSSQRMLILLWRGEELNFTFFRIHLKIGFQHVVREPLWYTICYRFDRREFVMANS